MEEIHGISSLPLMRILGLDVIERTTLRQEQFDSSIKTLA
jgi:hypothetical protein